MDKPMDRTQWLARGRSFGAVAGLYDRVRPGYPDAALDWLLPDRAGRVLDLGAGTGKLSRQLCDRGLEVVAVEPLTEMRAVLTQTVPGVDVRSGSAEHIPLPDADVDAVLAGQSWHWFDRDRAIQEVARVLRPGGALGLMWNSRDTSVRWVRDLWRIWSGQDTDSQLRAGPAPVPEQDWFEPVEHREFRHEQDLDLPSLLDLVRSRSYVIVLPEPEREALLERVATIVRTDPDLAGKDQFTMPYVTGCFRAVRV